MVNRSTRWIAAFVTLGAAGLLGLAPAVAAPSGGSSASQSGQVHHGPNGESDTDVCPTSPAPGTATCSAHRRTDSKAAQATPTRPGAVGGAATIGNSGAYDPPFLRSAYNVASLQGGGAGKTVAIVDAYDDPNAAADLASYRSFFGLSACGTGCFTKIDEHGGTSYPVANSGWSQEISLDLDMVSAICENCKILLVEAASSSITDLGTAVNKAVALGAVAVSNSYGGGEYSGETTDETTYYKHPGVAITVSSGDGGYGTEFPAASQYVTAVGGTSLNQPTNTGTRGSGTETAWSGAGSGCSSYEPKPKWQTDSGCSKRMVADVSTVADPNTGVWVYDTYRTGGTWAIFGGTSVASPIIGSVYALAGTPGAADYPSSYPYAAGAAGSLNDVTSGSNGSCSTTYFCTAISGYDGPTGLGTPNATGAFTTNVAPPSTPTAPQNLQANGGNASVSLTWQAPASNGGSAIQHYTLQRGDGPTFQVSSGTSYTDTSVTNGTAYSYTVTATNSVGTSAPSNPATATPEPVAPSAARNLTAAAGNATVTLTWSTPLSDGGAPPVTYSVNRNGSPLAGASGLTTLTYTDNAVTNGTTYSYTVTASNSVGPGPASNTATATPSAPATVPGAPTLSAAPTNPRGVRLTVTAPSNNGGSQVTQYQIYRGTASGGETFDGTVNCSSSTCSFKDPRSTSSGTTYYYKAYATNAVGTGPASNEASAKAR